MVMLMDGSILGSKMGGKHSRKKKNSCDTDSPKKKSGKKKKSKKKKSKKKKSKKKKSKK
jgi:hypothetical protein